MHGEVIVSACFTIRTSDIETMAVVRCSLRQWRVAVCWTWGQGRDWTALCSASWWDLMDMLPGST